MPVLSEASDRVLMALHRAKILACFEFVNLNSLAVTSDDYVTIFVFQFILFGFYHLVHAVVDVCVCAFEVIDAQDFVRLSRYINFIIFSVVDHASELWVNRGRPVISSVVFALCLGFLGDLPDR